MTGSQMRYENGADNASSGAPVMTGGRVVLVSALVVIVGLAGYLGLRPSWANLIFAHVGALGILGILGGVAGTIARWKGRDYRKAFLLALGLPAALGVVAVLLLYFLSSMQSLYCGGAVCLAAAILLILAFAIIRAKPNVPV